MHRLHPTPEDLQLRLFLDDAFEFIDIELTHLPEHKRGDPRFELRFDVGMEIVGHGGGWEIGIRKLEIGRVCRWGGNMEWRLLVSGWIMRGGFVWFLELRVWSFPSG